MASGVYGEPLCLRFSDRLLQECNQASYANASLFIGLQLADVVKYFKMLRTSELGELSSEQLDLCVDRDDSIEELTQCCSHVAIVTSV